MDVEQLITGIFEAPGLCIAIFDASLRYIAVNATLAAIHGIPVEAHQGRTLQEVVGDAAQAIKVPLLRVLQTHNTLQDIEIAAKMPTRHEVGFWRTTCFPIPDTLGRIKQVGALAVEITKVKKFEECLLHLMRNLPRARDQVLCAALPARHENDRTESWYGSIEVLDGCLEAMRTCSPYLKSPALLSTIAVFGDSRQVSLPFLEAGGLSSPAPDVANHKEEASTSPLSPRELQTVRLLAQGQSNKQIAVSLGITAKTVETYRSRIMLKLNFHSLSDLVRYAVRNKMIDA